MHLQSIALARDQGIEGLRDWLIEILGFPPIRQKKGEWMGHPTSLVDQEWVIPDENSSA